VFTFNKGYKTSFGANTCRLRAHASRSHLAFEWSLARLDQVWIESSWRRRSTRKLWSRFV